MRRIKRTTRFRRDYRHEGQSRDQHRWEDAASIDEEDRDAMTLPTRPPKHKPRGRQPENALSVAFVRNASRSGRYCDGGGSCAVTCSQKATC